MQHYPSPRRSAFTSLAVTAALAALVASPVRAQVAVAVDATSAVRVVDERVFGVNTPFWDSHFTNATSLDALTQMGTRFLRYGGGSDTDETDWSTNMDTRRGFPWAFNIDAFAVQAKALNAQAIITTNYGSGTPAAAAAYVAYANGTKGYGFKYWEVGNEIYGTWEYDTHTNPHDPYTYGVLAAQYIQQRKAADPTIKVGVVVVTGEDTYAVGYTSHTVTNPRTNQQHNGWTPVLLSTLKAAGVLPDFLIYHRYEQNPGQESDAGLLQMALTWPSDAANLRQQLTDYLGSAGAGIELLVTENNSVNSNPGKQSVSLVNGLYMADSVANVMQTEFNSLNWWAFFNGQTSQSATSPINVSPSLYGWRTTYGDFGIQYQDTGDRYPTVYVAKLLSHFARGGDTVIKASTNNPLLSAYAVKRLNGTVTILAINKSPTASYSTTFTITGFVPQGSATVYSYGMPQDNAAQTPGGSASPDIAVSTMSGAGPSFTATFAPYSASVVTLTGPTASAMATSQPASQTVATGAAAAFTFGATGSPAPTYQWFLNGAPVAGATSSTFVVHGAGAADAGTYTAVATNASGSVTSNPATLAVSGFLHARPSDQPFDPRPGGHRRQHPDRGLCRRRQRACPRARLGPGADPVCRVGRPCRPAASDHERSPDSRGFKQRMDGQRHHQQRGRRGGGVLLGRDAGEPRRGNRDLAWARGLYGPGFRAVQ